MRWPIRSALAALILGTLPAPALAGFELVTNGGFETGDFTGWNAGAGNKVMPGFGVAGGFGVRYGSVGVTSPVYQDIATTPGASYTFRFSQRNIGGQPNDFLALWNGGLVLELKDSPTSASFTPYSFTQVATSTLTRIEFDLRQDPDYGALDEVSVQVLGQNAATVPEPSSMTMLASALALGAVGNATHRRRAAARTAG